MKGARRKREMVSACEDARPACVALAIRGGGDGVPRSSNGWSNGFLNLLFRSTPARRQRFRLISKRAEQRAHLLVHVRGIGQRLCNFVAEQDAVTLAQAMHGHTHGGIIHAKLLRGFGV